MSSKFDPSVQILIHLRLPRWWRNVWVMMRYGTGRIERFIEVYHAAHSAPAPVLLLAIEVFASGRSSTHCVHQMVVNLVLVRPSEGHSLNSTLHHQCHCRHPQVI